MILYGKNITSPNDELKKLSVEMLYRAIRSPKPESIALIRNLRIVKNINKQGYAQQKRRLPYIVCGSFNPPYRRTENFASIQIFIIDLDHLEEKEVNIDELKTRLAADSRVLMCFVSPSGDGLKVMFRLKERCHDSGLYGIFYRHFAAAFGKQYGIEQVVDARTCDATRACFMSYDPTAHYNPQAEAIDLSQYVDTSSTIDLFATKKEQAATTPLQPSSKDLPQDSISKIKEILNLANKRKAAKPEAYVPEQLNDIMDDLQQYITQTGVTIKEIRNIQYGKKIQCLIGAKQTETNIFYGKRGFTVVLSPRSGTDPAANELIGQLIQSFFDTRT